MDSRIISKWFTPIRYFVQINTGGIIGNKALNFTSWLYSHKAYSQNKIWLLVVKYILANMQGLRSNNLPDKSIKWSHTWLLFSLGLEGVWWTT